MRSKKKKRQKKYKPYEPIKRKFFHVPDPFGNAPLEVRRAAVHEAAVKARASFNADYPKMAGWFETYDGLYLLSFCVYYFLTSPEGIDKEAIEGKLDFASFQLELLQAFALMRPRSGTARPIGPKTEDLLCYLQGLADSLSLAQADFPEDVSEAEVRKKRVISEMRGQSFAVRNWAYPEQALGHLKSMFTGALGDIIAGEYAGVSIARVIDVLKLMSERAEERLNDHIKKMVPVVSATSFDSAYSSYEQAFPDMEHHRDGMLEVFNTQCGANLEVFQSFLIAHSDLRLDQIFTFKLDDAVRAYGDESCRIGLGRLLSTWSYEFGDLGSHDPMRFLYTNPVLQRPLVRLDDESFYWALSGVYTHTLPAMLELLIPNSQRQLYMTTRSHYLEDQVETLCRKAFPSGKVHRGSQFRLEPGGIEYENDILVVVDSTAIIIECKAHLVDAPARRGAELRLADTIEDLVVEASQQAHRFVDFLKANPRRHQLTTKSGHANRVNASRLLRFIPISVTYESLGFISANLKVLVEAGMIDPGQSLAPSICLTDLEVILETLDSQTERIHYLARRSEIERTMHYHGDELDLFALYVDTGFNFGDLEGGGYFVDLGLKSKELDPYFVGRAKGVAVPKPKLRLTEWWQQILSRIEEVRTEFWTEVAYVFLSVAYEDQEKFERQLKDLSHQIKRGQRGHKHNWLAMVSGTRAMRQHGVFGFPYGRITREERNEMIGHMVAEFERDTPVFGSVVLAINREAPHYPYDALVFAPGKAPGAIDFRRMMPGLSGGSWEGDFDFHLKSPRPRPFYEP